MDLFDNLCKISYQEPVDTVQQFLYIQLMRPNDQIYEDPPSPFPQYSRSQGSTNQWALRPTEDSNFQIEQSLFDQPFRPEQEKCKISYQEPVDTVQQFLQIQLMRPNDQIYEDPPSPFSQYSRSQGSTNQWALRPTEDSDFQIEQSLFDQPFRPEYEKIPLSNSDDSRKEGSTQGLLYTFEMEKEQVISLPKRAPSEDSRIAITYVTQFKVHRQKSFSSTNSFIPLSQNSKNIKRKNKQPPKATETKNFLTGQKNLVKKRGKLLGWNFTTMSRQVQMLIDKSSCSIDGFITLLKDPDISSLMKTYLRSSQYIIDVMASNLEEKKIYFTYFSKLNAKMDNPDTITSIK